MNGLLQRSGSINMHLYLPTSKSGTTTGPSGVPILTCDQTASLYHVERKQVSSALYFPE